MRTTTPSTRAHGLGTQGYADSVDYVAGLLEDAGYQVTLDEFDFEFTFPAVLRQLTPPPAASTRPAASRTAASET